VHPVVGLVVLVGVAVLVGLAVLVGGAGGVLVGHWAGKGLAGGLAEGAGGLVGARVHGVSLSARGRGFPSTSTVTGRGQ